MSLLVSRRLWVESGIATGAGFWGEEGPPDAHTQRRRPLIKHYRSIGIVKAKSC